jgi:hypothetical protein
MITKSSRLYGMKPELMREAIKNCKFDYNDTTARIILGVDEANRRTCKTIVDAYIPLDKEYVPLCSECKHNLVCLVSST